MRDQIVVKLRQHHPASDRGAARSVGDRPPADARRTCRRICSRAARHALPRFSTASSPAWRSSKAPSRRRARDGVLISEHPDELVSVEDDFGGRASPEDYISGSRRSCART